MGSKSMKSLLGATFSLIMLLYSSPVFSQEKPQVHGNSGEKFNPTKEIMGHVQDAYEFHFFSVGNFHATIHLPVILYSPQKGFSVFSSSRFGEEHDQVYDGYRLAGNKIAPVEKG